MTKEYETSCFHCGLPIPRGSQLSVRIDNENRPMCCLGCQAVAQTIVDQGLSDFYRHRTAPAPNARDVLPAFLEQLRSYDHPTIQKAFVHSENGRIKEAALILEGITCAACVWLNEQHLHTLSGIQSVQINYATHRAQVRWDDAVIKLSDILRAIAEIGYRAVPYDPARQQQQTQQLRHRLLRRLAVSAALGMQVMILAVAMYQGDWLGMEDGIRSFFRWLSLALTVPVLLYSATPFLEGGWRDIRHTRIGMDVPVSLALLLAFATSTLSTIKGYGHIYFDTVCMFVFFLLGARYLELMARIRATQGAEAFTHSTPLMATRITNDVQEDIPAFELQPGDNVLIRPGEFVPADGSIVSGKSTFNESLLTGESTPVGKQEGSKIIGSTVNIDQPVTMRVEKAGQDTVAAGLQRMLERAQSEKPRLAQLADRIAGRFLMAVIVIAAGVTVYWWFRDLDKAVPVLIAVLVISCPCALSLATPTAIAQATATLARRGILTTGTQSLEVLATASHFVFDKTGTLTLGRPKVSAVIPTGNLAREDILAVSSSLEAHSDHPVARALRDTPHGRMKVSQLRDFTGMGISGTINEEHWYIGSIEFIKENCGMVPSESLMAQLRQEAGTVVLLVRGKTMEAAIVLDDPLRDGAMDLVASLLEGGKKVSLLTGDNAIVANRIGKNLGITEIRHSQIPEQKLEYVKGLQHRGHKVVMIGDGINDAPVLAVAHTSIAMGSGAALAASAADILFLSPHIKYLMNALTLASRMFRIIKQNLGWAIAYNFTAIPLAASGMVQPWMAAIGMSASSLLVVLNAQRLGIDSGFRKL